MPIFEQGYQHWHGRLHSHGWSWLTITRNGVRAQFRNRWTKVVLALALFPAFALAAFTILWGLFEQKASMVQPLLAMLEKLPDELKQSPRAYRVTVWTLLFFGFFQIQMFFSMLLVLFVGPSLISQDLRFNAMPLYLARPLNRLDYFAGKLGVIGTYLIAVILLPLALAYVLGVAFSLDLSVVVDTARLFAASIGYALVIVISAGTLMLALSSLTRNSRYVGAMWMGLWIITNSLAGVLTGILQAKWCPVVSYTANLTRLCEQMLNTQAAWQQIAALFHVTNSRAMQRLIERYPWYWSAGVLLGLLAISLWILTSRVKSLDRLK
jgi:ABC-2 type transport system permease protein